jgi:2-oxoisovalerate dehydrogenase E1 component
MKMFSKSQMLNIRNEYQKYIESELEIGYAANEMVPDLEEEVNDVYAPTNSIEVSGIKIQNRKTSREIRFIDAIKEGLQQSMQQHQNLILMGQDIAEYGGAFKITEGFVEQFGKERVRNTPFVKAQLLVAALGLSLKDTRA